MQVAGQKYVRSLAHLETDTNLYEYMLSQVDIHLKSCNYQLDHGFLQEGLHKGQKLELVFANGESKPDINLAANSEVPLSFALRAVLPRKWNDAELPLEGQESYVIYFDNNKTVSMLRLRENVEHIYTSQVLPLLELRAEDVPLDKQQFTEDVLRRMLIFSPKSPVELAVALRGLPALFREKKPVGLVVVDSLNTYTTLSGADEDQQKDVPTLEGDTAGSALSLHKRGLGAKKRKTKSFDLSLYGKCGELLQEYWEEHKFALIITRVDNTTLPPSVKGVDVRPRDEVNDDEEEPGAPLRPSAYPVIDIHLKKLAKEQWLVVADAKCKLYEQLCEYTQFKGVQGPPGLLVIAKAAEDLEYDMLILRPRDNTLYVELETLDRKKVKLAN